MEEDLLAMGKSKTVVFCGRKYKFGDVYEYEDLLPTAQEDARNSSSIDEDIEGYTTAPKWVYELVLIPFAEAKIVVAKLMKKYNVSDWSIGRAEELADDISLNGLEVPPTGAEGFHRLMALVQLGLDVPYFRMIRKSTGGKLGGAFF